MIHGLLLLYTFLESKNTSKGYSFKGSARKWLIEWFGLNNEYDWNISFRQFYNIEIIEVIINVLAIIIINHYCCEINNKLFNTQIVYFNSHHKHYSS